MPKSTATNIDKQLTQVRPRIYQISPIAGFGTLGFGVLNVFLGTAIFSVQSTFAGGISVLNYIFNYQFWGAMFFLSGILLLYGFTRNNWQLMRYTLVVTLSFKLIWLFALLFRFILEYSNPTLLLLWAFIAFVQMLFYIHFIPVPPKSHE